MTNTNTATVTLVIDLNNVEKIRLYKQADDYVVKCLEWASRAKPAKQMEAAREAKVAMGYLKKAHTWLHNGGCQEFAIGELRINVQKIKGCWLKIASM
jgi:hypothetical protein